jgi:phosphonate transport system substrate-binding protein
VIDYLNAAGSHHYELRVSTDYRDAVQRLRRGEVAASFLGAWIVRRDGREAGLAPLIAPRDSSGQTRFHDVLIVPHDSTIRSLEDLSGRRVAVPSRDSWAGNWLGCEALPAVDMSIADLDTLHHFAHHETVVWRVLHGSYDAGVVKQSVAARYLGEGLRIAAISDPIPGPPLVARAGDAGAAVAEIRRLLLDIDPAEPEHARILAGWTPEFAWGFAPVDWQAYATPMDGRR